MAKPIFERGLFLPYKMNVLQKMTIFKKCTAESRTIRDIFTIVILNVQRRHRKKLQTRLGFHAKVLLQKECKAPG